jgi:dipeptidase E
MSEIIAIGGAAFSAEPRNLALDRYLLDVAGKTRPKVLLISTARGDDAEYVRKFYDAYDSLDATPAHLRFFHRTPDIREAVMAHDVVFVGGGNTKSMLAVWREWGLPEILREASESGVVLGGVSAGAICWFEQGVTDSWADRLRPLPCMGWLPGSCCPHYDGEAERRPAYHALILQGHLRPGFAIEDGVALHFSNGVLERVVTKSEGSRAYYVSVEEGRIREDAFAPTLLPPIPTS